MNTTYAPKYSSPMHSPELVHSGSLAQALGVPLAFQQVALHRIVVAQLASTVTVLSCNKQPAAVVHVVLSVMDTTSM